FRPAIDSISERSKRLNFLVQHQGKSDSISVVYSNSVRHNLSVKEENKGFYTPSRKVKISTNYPVSEINPDYISVRRDTLDLPFQIIREEKNQNAFTLDFPIDLNSAYEVNLLPDAITDF